MEYIDSTTTAKLIRRKLKATWPEVKFSVRKDGQSIRIDYKNGPALSLVENIVAGYEGEGFDGMIDMRYNKTSWLLLDGSAVFAETDGTEGSRGVVPSRKKEKPSDDARLVHFGTAFIFVSREIDREIIEEERVSIAKEYGEAYESGVTSPWAVQIGNRNLSQMANIAISERSL